MTDDIRNILNETYMQTIDNAVTEISNVPYSSRTSTEWNDILETYSEEEIAIKNIHSLRLKHQQEIRDYIIGNNLLQEQDEQNLAQEKLNHYKMLYEKMNDMSAKYYKDIDEQEADIYERAVANGGKMLEEDKKRLKELEKDRLKSEENITKRKKELNDKLSDSLGKAFKTIANRFFDMLASGLNNYMNVMYSDQMKKGMSDFNTAYEQNFTELAGRMGTNRSETHNLIGDGLDVVNNDNVLSKALNYSNDVMPEILNATKSGFSGDEAIEIGISRALDKKIVPWLETSSETWTHLEYNLSDDSLRQIKGQQLLLQETREGNRILQTGVADALMNELAPTLQAIDANTTTAESMGAAYEAVEQLMAKGMDKASAVKFVKDAISADQNTYKALTSGDPAMITMAMGAMNGGGVAGAIENYSNTWGNMLAGAQGNEFAIGIINELAGGYLAADYDNFAPILSGLKITGKYDNENLNDKAYSEAIDGAVEKVTATQAHDNAIQNEYAQKILSALEKPHAADIQIEIFNEITNLRQDLVRYFVGNVLGNLVGNLLEKVGNKIGDKIGGKLFNSGSSGGSSGGTLTGGGISKGLVAGASVMGAVTGAYTGISQAYNDSTEYTERMLNGKDDARNTEDYKAFKESLENKHKAKVTGAVTGGVIGGVAGAAGGIWAGAALGAAAGTVVPGIGNAVGAVVGGVIGLIGGLVGAKAGEAIGDAVSPLQSVLSNAAVESLNNLDIMKQNWDEEVLERQNLVTAMKDTTDIEVQKRMLLDAGIDSNLVNMAKTDEALDSLAQSALNTAEVNNALANASTGLTVGINDDAATDTFKQLQDYVLLFDSENRRKQLTNILSLMDIDSDTRKEIEKSIKNSKWIDGTTDNDVANIIGEIKAAAGESDIRAIAGTYNLTYDTMNMKYLNQLNTAIMNEDKDAAIDAINMLKADNVNGGTNSWDKIKENPEYQESLGNLGIDVNQYKLGSSYIPHDMIAQLHAGERVLTADQNKDYTQELVSGNDSTSIIQVGLQDIVIAIKTQTSEIINYLSTINLGNFSNKSIFNTLPEMGNTKVTM